MARKKTYIYHMLIGNDDKQEVDELMWAKNAADAVAFCQELYRDKHYNSYRAIKVGVSKDPRETGFVSEEDAKKMRAAGATRSEQFAENNMGLSWNQKNPGDGFYAVGDLPEQVKELLQPAGE